MKIVTQAKVVPEKPSDLLGVMRRFNSACNWLSVYAYQNKAFNWYKLQQANYYHLRELFGLTAAEAHVVIRKVAASYQDKARRKSLAKFKPLGAMPLYRQSYKRDGQVLIYGQRYPLVSRSILNAKHEGLLCYQQGKFIIHQFIEVDERQPYIASDFMGCDLGVANILVDSDGEVHSSGHLYGLRKRYHKIRSRLDRKQSRSAKRLLRKRRRKESLFARDVNHCISKKVVAKAKDTLRGIALEDLKGIRERITVRRPQRRQHHSWAFNQLRFFIEYKAKLAGVPVVLVDPRNTSRTCPECGYTDKKNRKSQSEFSCNSCGYADLADYVAARNIASRAAGNQPYAAPLLIAASPLTEEKSDVDG